MTTADTGWAAAIERLRRQTGVAPALAAAALLLVLRPEWEQRVVARTAGHELLFTRPGEDYPFPLDVRVGLVGKTYAVRLVNPAGILETTEVGAADLDAVVAAYLLRLLADHAAGSPRD